MERSCGCTAAAVASAGHLDRWAALAGDDYEDAARPDTLISLVNIGLRTFLLLKHLFNPDSKSFVKLCHRYKDCRRAT